MKNSRCWLLIIATILSHLLVVHADEQTQRQPLTGRVEAFSGGAEPVLPSDLLGSVNSRNPISTSISESGTLPQNLRGEWFGRITISQMDTYPNLHPEPYCQRFIQEISHYFESGKSGQLSLQFEPRSDGSLAVASSDIFFSRGLKVALTAQPAPALVAGGTNMPRPVRNDVTMLTDNRIEQTRIDYVTIVETRFRRPIHYGFTEVTAQYQIVAPRRMKIRILNVDYDQDGKPLWRALMEGELRRWTRGKA